LKLVAVVVVICAKLQLALRQRSTR